MNGVGRHVRVIILELYIDHNQVVDMIQMVSDLVGRELPSGSMDDKVSAGSVGDLVGNMWGNVKLSITPAKLKLVMSAKSSSFGSVAYPLCMQIDVFPLYICQKFRSAFYKRYRGGPVIA